MYLEHGLGPEGCAEFALHEDVHEVRPHLLELGQVRRREWLRGHGHAHAAGRAPRAHAVHGWVAVSTQVRRTAGYRE